MDRRGSKRTTSVVIGDKLVEVKHSRRISPRKQRFDERHVVVVEEEEEELVVVQSKEYGGQIIVDDVHDSIDVIGDEYASKITPAFVAQETPEYDFDAPLECVECGFTTADRTNLQRHMASHRWADFICHMCNEIFDCLSSKQAHVCRAELKGRVRCPRCPQMVHNYLQLCGHVENSHQIECDVNRVLMNSDEEFVDWRQRVQREFGFQWRVQNCTADNTRHFICNRSGVARDRRTGQRVGWKKGLVRTGETCTSFARVKRYPNGKFCVTYCLSHTHELDPKALRIDMETEEAVVKLIIDGHDVNGIVDRVRGGMDVRSSGGPSAREIIFNQKDVENIAQRRGVKAPLRYACKTQRPMRMKDGTTASSSANNTSFTELGIAGERLSNAAALLRLNDAADNSVNMDDQAGALIRSLHRMTGELETINCQLRSEWVAGTSQYLQAALDNIQLAVNFNEQTIVYEGKEDYVMEVVEEGVDRPVTVVDELGDDAILEVYL